MKRKYITFNPRLIENLAALGFKRKNKDMFVKEETEVRLELSFCHSTNNEHFVKYYYVIFGILFPEVKRIADEIGEIMEVGVGGNIGYLSPENYFTEWRLADADDDETESRIIDEISQRVRDYIVPICERYSTIHQILCDNERGVLKKSFYIYLPTLILLYYISGNTNLALQYADEVVLGKRELPSAIPMDFFIDFTRRFKEYVNTHGDYKRVK